MAIGLASPKRSNGKAKFPGFLVPDISQMSTKLSFRNPDEKLFVRPNMPRALNIKDKRRMNPTEYRGPNMSDCMYNTMQSFNQGRQYVSPKNKTSPDWKIPLGGVNCV
jgi:hypothetical protein